MQRGSSDPAQKGTPQGAAFTASAHRSRRGPAAVALATIAFLGVALLIKQATSVVSVPVASVAEETSHGAAASPSAIGSATPTASSTSGPPARDPTAKPHPTFVAVPVKAGTTRLSPAGPTAVSVTVALPHGWERESAAIQRDIDRLQESGAEAGEKLQELLVRKYDVIKQIKAII